MAARRSRRLGDVDVVRCCGFLPVRAVDLRRWSFAASSRRSWLLPVGREAALGAIGVDTRPDRSTGRPARRCGRYWPATTISSPRRLRRSPTGLSVRLRSASRRRDESDRQEGATLKACRCWTIRRQCALTYRDARVNAQPVADDPRRCRATGAAMLNYIWAGLIVFSFVFALVNDCATCGTTRTATASRCRSSIEARRRAAAATSTVRIDPAVYKGILRRRRAARRRRTRRR